MRKTQRLDQILFRLGYVTQDQIASALHRQEAEGGRLGMNLVHLGSITEEQLFDALVEQFRVPSVIPDESSVPPELLERMPREAAVEYLMLPLAWNESQRVLSLAVANPSAEDPIQLVKEAFGAKAVRVSLAPEALLAELAETLLGAGKATKATGVELPELFEMETGEADTDEEADEEADARSRVLMVTSARSLKNFLPPLFQREGYGLIVATSLEEAAEALAELSFTAVLVSSEMDSEFARWIGEGLVREPVAEVTRFSSVSSSLLDNPLPYQATAQSLRNSVQALAEYRCAQHGATPPYGLMAHDIEALADRLALPRVACDGLNLSLHLLLAAATGADAAPSGTLEPFEDFATSLELSRRIRFPWALDRLLAACHGLYTGRVAPAGRETGGDEVLQAAQALAIVWFRHTLVATKTGTDEETMIALRAGLREQADRLATLELIEAYLQVIAERGGVGADRGEGQALLVGGERISRTLARALRRVGCEALITGDLADAQTMAERRPPGAIIVDHEVFTDEVQKFSRVAKLDESVLLFVLTDSTDPSLVLNLLDVGVDDVFGPPHDFDLVAARVSRAIRSRSEERRSDATEAGQFSATFEHFSFLDLAQMLSHGLKTVQVDLSRSTGEEAVLFMEKGKPVHATCGDLTGAPAVYRVIAWEEDGEFTVREGRTFPEPTIQESIESLLMEGCRLLDESSV